MKGGQPPLWQARDAVEQDVGAPDPLAPAVMDRPSQGDRRRGVDQDEAIHLVWVRQRRLGGNDAAPLVSNYMRLRHAEGVDQCCDVIAEGLERVVVDACWPARVTEASHIWGHRSVSRPGQGRGALGGTLHKPLD